MAKEVREGHGATTVVEAGRKGGQRVKELYGAKFYAEIGKKGGQAIADDRGSDYYAEIGKRAARPAVSATVAVLLANRQEGWRGRQEQARSRLLLSHSQEGGEAPRRADRRASSPPSGAGVSAHAHLSYLR